jgi:hypothetical protein
MKGQHLTIKEKRAKLGFLPALTNPRRRRDFADYLQNPHTPHVNGRYKAPLGFKQFCKASRNLEKIQARLKILSDANQWEAQEYRELEREESKLCTALGY